MRNFKGVNFATLLCSEEAARELLSDLKEFLSKSRTDFSSNRSDAERRQVCDAILRACNQQLTAKLDCPGHLRSLLNLAELACDGYLLSTPQRPPLYLERILFILLRNGLAQGSPDTVVSLAQPLHSCLLQSSPEAAPKDYEAVVRGSFSVLWKGAEALPERRAALSTRLKALGFLALLEDDSVPCEVPHFASPTACRAVAAYQLFSAHGPCLDDADADFLYDLLSRHVIRVLVCKAGSSPGPLSPQRALCLLELTLEHCRRLCWSHHHHKATSVVAKARDHLENSSVASSLQLCQVGVELLEAAEKRPGAVAQILIKASTILNGSMEAPSPPLRAMYDSCQFFLSGLERGIKRHYGLDTILNFFVFLGGYCSLVRQLRDVSEAPSKPQQCLLQMHFQGLHLFTGMVYDFAQDCQVAKLTQLVDCCRSAVVWMLEAVEGLSGRELTNYLSMTASYTSNLAYSFFSHKLYDEACAVLEPVCQHLGLAKSGACPDMPPEKLHRCFRLHVESLKKLGKQAQGCEMVTLWLAALQPYSLEHMVEPVTFWVRVKMDAARAGNKELQLKTLRESLSGWDSETQVLLLREELRAYKAVRADTGQDRFNVICDLLELSPEETAAGAWARATHLVELSQVLCYHSFAQQTNCSALDAIQEALQLLESVRPEAQERDRLLDDKAQALLWLYICTLEAKMQEGIERDRRAQAPSNLEEFEVNDLNYEDKLQEDGFLYSNIAFNLAADAAHCKCLDQALTLWKEVLTKGPAPAVRCLQQTAASLQTLAALYQLVAKPLQALETLLLLQIVFEGLQDHTKAVSSSCQITQQLLSLGCPSYAQLYLEEAESSLKTLEQMTDTCQLLSLTCALLRSQLCWTCQKVTEGVPLLLSILRDPALQRSSKAWYLLRVQALQTLALYLSLSSNILSGALRKQLWDRGWQTPETALLDAHKLLRSIVILLMGSDVLSVQRAAVEPAFLDYGENLVQKWQVLTEVLSCSEKLVGRLGRLGNVSEAKAFCLEALKLTTKLQLPRQCALFLVLKGELELARGDLDLCQSDLQRVLFLLESSTEFGVTQHTDSVKKVHMQKGKQQTQVCSSPQPPEEEPFLRGPALELVATVLKEPGPIQPSANSSPVLKTKLPPNPGFLSHSTSCDCSLCASPTLSVVCLRWVLVTAGVKLATGHKAQGLDLLQAVLKGVPAATKRFTQCLQALLKCRTSPCPLPVLFDELMAQVYTHLALECLNHTSEKSLGKVLALGLKFVATRIQYLEFWQANLLLVQALAKLSSFSCCPTQLFAKTWGWQPPLIKCPTVLEPSKIQRGKCSGQGRQQVASAPQPLYNSIQKGLEEERPPCTPKPPGRARQAGPCIPFTIFEEVHHTKSKPEVPLAPRIPRRAQTRLKVTFSDDSDLEDIVAAEAQLVQEPKRRGAASRGRGQSRKGPSPKTDAVVAAGSIPGQSSLSGRSRRVKKVASRHCEESPKTSLCVRASLGPEVMRTIPEEDLTDNQLEMSFETLRASDGEDSASGERASAAGPGLPIGECEVLRRDSGKAELPVLYPDKEASSDPSHWLQPHLVPVPIDLSTLDAISDSLSSAFRGVSHCPPSVLYAHLCRLLALCLGHRDPYATAFLVADSVSITCRHQVLTHLHRQLSRAQKQQGSLELPEHAQGLNLKEKPGDIPLARIQHLFSFGAVGSECFPEAEKDSFQERLALIPSGVTVCVLALATLQPGTLSNTLLVTRLEKDNPPVTVKIPTAQNKVPLSSVLKEFDAIQKGQKENSSCTEKRAWWTGRLALDQRMEELITSLEEHVLGCWRGLLLPCSADSGPAQEASRLQELLQECGWEYPDSTLLKVILSGARTLTSQDVQALAYGLCPNKPERARVLLTEAVGRVKSQAPPPSQHLVLVLDKDLQKLPWESMPSLRALPVTRLPSFYFLLSYSITREAGASSVLSLGVDPRNTFYVLNPHSNLSSTEERFRASFSSEAGWKGVIGEVPSLEQLQAALTEHDLYIYAGHGAGARFLDGQAVLRLSCRAVALLFGCSSAALAVHGNMEGAGIVLKYIMAGCPLFLGNLWDVTDRDIDRYTEALLQGWLGAGPGSPLLCYVSQARQAPRLKYLIGAAPVAYGLPVWLQTP